MWICSTKSFCTNNYNNLGLQDSEARCSRTIVAVTALRRTERLSGLVSHNTAAESLLEREVIPPARLSYRWIQTSFLVSFWRAGRKVSAAPHGHFGGIMRWFAAHLLLLRH